VGVASSPLPPAGPTAALWLNSSEELNWVVVTLGVTIVVVRWGGMLAAKGFLDMSTRSPSIAIDGGLRGGLAMTANSCTKKKRAAREL